MQKQATEALPLSAVILFLSHFLDNDKGLYFRHHTLDNLISSDVLKKYNVTFEDVWYFAPRIRQVKPFNTLICLIWTPPLIELPRLLNVGVSCSSGTQTFSNID